MDPNAALKRLIDASVAGDADEVWNAAGDLWSWLKGGGFPPADPRVEKSFDFDSIETN